jgi:hypothetical protein
MIAINLLTYNRWDDTTLNSYGGIQNDAVFANLEAYVYQARVIANRAANRSVPPKPEYSAGTEEDDDPEQAPPLPSRGRVVLSSHLNESKGSKVDIMSKEEKDFVNDVLDFMVDQRMMHDGHGGAKYMTILIPERHKLKNDTQFRFIQGSLHSFILNQTPHSRGERWNGCKTVSGKRGLDYFFDRESRKIYPMDTERTRAVKRQVGTTIQHPSGQVFGPQVTVKRFRKEIPVSPAFSVSNAGISSKFFKKYNMIVSLRRIHGDR